MLDKSILCSLHVLLTTLMSEVGEDVRTESRDEVEGEGLLLGQLQSMRGKPRRIDTRARAGEGTKHGTFLGVSVLCIQENSLTVEWVSEEEEIGRLGAGYGGEEELDRGARVSFRTRAWKWKAR
jgi:hypothetical protein